MSKASATPEQLALGKRLSAVMAYRNMGLTKTATATGISRATLWRYMKGLSSQPFTTIASLSKVLSSSLDYLAYGEGPMIVGLSDHPVIEVEDSSE